MIVENLFEDVIFPQLKAYVEEHSTYNPIVTKAMPQNSDTFPIVPVKLLPTQNKYNNLNYSQETYTLGIEINVYAIANGGISKRTICNEITNTIVDYIKSTYNVIVKVELDALNVDSTVQRNNIKITGKVSTINGIDNLIIVPN